MANHYAVEAQVIPGFEADLLAVLESGSLGQGTLYAQELRQALHQARLDGRTARWIETCHCASPLAAERQDLEQYFIIRRVQVLKPGDPRPDLPGEPLREALQAIVAAGPRFNPFKT